MGVSSQFFISAVSSEFASYRAELKRHLDGAHRDVKVQEHFVLPTRSLLELLDDYIRECTCVVHLIGRSTGSRPQPAEVAMLLSRHRRLYDLEPIKRDLAGNSSPYSYTQWEAYLAHFHGTPLLKVEAAEGSVRQPGWVEMANEVLEQDAHIQRLKTLGHWPTSAVFHDARDIAIEVLRSLPRQRSGLDRRKIIALAGVAAGGVAIGVAGPHALSWAKQVYAWAQQNPHQSDARLLFAEIFGTPDELRRSDHGDHPDNLQVHDYLCSLLGFCDARPQLNADTSLQEGNFEGDLVSFGGPNSTTLTMLAWEFKGETRRALRRDPNPLVPLRYTGVSDEDHERVPKYRIAYRQPKTPDYHLSVPWTFEDHYENRFLEPRKGRLIGQMRDKGGRIFECFEPFEDYLCVARLPNFVGSRRVGPPENWPKLSVFDGGMGIGTRGAELLATPDGLRALTDAKAQVGRAEGFQAMFRVLDPEIGPEGYHRFRKIELVKGSVTPLSLRASTYEKAHAKVREQLATTDWTKFNE